MTLEKSETYQEHPVFRQAMTKVQKGEWEAGIELIERLTEAFPFETELRSLRQEMALRARIDQDEREDKAMLRRRRIRNLAIRLGTVSVLVVLAFFVITTYSRFINEQVAMARESVEYQMLTLELSVKFRDAEDYLRAGQTETALNLLNEIQAVNPNYAGLNELMEQARRQQRLDEQYNHALELRSQGNMEAALETFRELEEEEPFFRDVRTQIEQIERSTTLGVMLASADQAFEASNWLEAATLYEELYVYNPNFETAKVEDRLFTSYVKAAEQILRESESLEAIQTAEEYYRKALSLRPQEPSTKARQEQVRSMVEERLFYGYIDLAQRALAEEPDSLEALELANEYFAEALKIRPNSPEIAAQGELAYRFVQSLEYLDGRNWDAAIDNLEFIYSQEFGYAGGTARQALYEARVGRGDEEMAIGNFDDALADYQRAAVVAKDDPSSKLRLYESQLKIAEVTGLLGDYADAVQLYDAAITDAGFEERAQGNDSMASALEAAETAQSRNDYEEAYRNYREAVTFSSQAFELVEHVVESGEYLSSIAVDYNSTVSLIAAANNMENPNLIITGQTLQIPVLP